MKHQVFLIRFKIDLYDKDTLNKSILINLITFHWYQIRKAIFGAYSNAYLPGNMLLSMIERYLFLIDKEIHFFCQVSWNLLYIVKKDSNISFIKEMYRFIVIACVIESAFTRTFVRNKCMWPCSSFAVFVEHDSYVDTRTTVIYISHGGFWNIIITDIGHWGRMIQNLISWSTGSDCYDKYEVILFE